MRPSINNLVKLRLSVYGFAFILLEPMQCVTGELLLLHVSLSRPFNWLLPASSASTLALLTVTVNVFDLSIDNVPSWHGGLRLNFMTKNIICISNTRNIDVVQFVTLMRFDYVKYLAPNAYVYVPT